jgi:hypothetical protein
VDAHRLAQLSKQIIDEYRQARDVIHMRVRDDHIADSLLLRFSQGDANAAGIDRDAIIDHKASEALRGIRALRIERTW